MSAREVAVGLTKAQLDDVVYRAAIKWCGKKDRETFPEDIEYFKHNWRWASGLLAEVRAILQEQPQ